MNDKKIAKNVQKQKLNSRRQTDKEMELMDFRKINKIENNREIPLYKKKTLLLLIFISCTFCILIAYISMNCCIFVYQLLALCYLRISNF